MKILILTFLAVILICGTHTASAALERERMAGVIQKCDDVDPGDEDHFE